MPIIKKGMSVIILLTVFTVLLRPGIGACSETVTYQYDELNRLKQATYGDGTVINYTYDEIGNILTQTVNQPAMYTITATQTAGGTISPSTATVTQNGSASFSITPDSGFYIVDVLVDGSSMGNGNSFSFSNVSKNYTLSATYTQYPFRVVGKGDYSSLQTAYDIAAEGDTIKCQSVIFTGNLTANRNIFVTIDGGYNVDYSSNATDTDISGMITINSGTVNIKNINLQN